jgi:RNA polymerase sigma-70 factor (ECF subfamily)
MEREDRELVDRFQQGDEVAFNQLVMRHRQSVYFLALGLLNSVEDAEDLAQDAFVRAYEGMKKFRSHSSFRTWIYRITLNLCLNEIRKRKVRQMFSLESLGLATISRDKKPDEAMEHAERHQVLNEAIAKLPPKQKQVFVLRHFSELPHAEIAEIMGRNVGTIKANYFQAIQKLRSALSKI